MKFSFLILLAFFQLFPIQAHAIIGGREVRYEDYPWLAKIHYGGLHKCGGTIISNRYILTAAHCVNMANFKSLATIFGAGFRSLGPVEDIIIHDHHNPNTLENDIALIKLRDEILFTNDIQKIELAKRNDLTVGDALTVLGWGETDPRNIRRHNTWVLKEAVLRVIPEGQSSFWSNEKIDEYFTEPGDYEMWRNLGTQVIGLFEINVSTSYGDSGGPLVLGGKLYGVTSWGSRLNSLFKMNAFTSVPEFYSWIEEEVVDL